MKRTSFIVAGILFALGMGGTASALPSSVRIVELGHSGTGCPLGTVDASVINAGSQLFVGFDEFIAQTEPGGPSFARKNCQLRVLLEFDPAWSVSLVSADYRGFAALEAGVRGEQKSTYFFQGTPPPGDSFATTVLSGPFFENYARRDDLALLVFSKCGPSRHNLIINSEVRVLGREGLMTVDSVSQQVEHVYELSWRRCS
jgi:hypothetical protein